MAVEILYESDNFLVVNKPYDMYINSDDENEKNTVTHHIASGDSHLSTSVNPIHFVQRLDYSTSGVLCIAKNKTAAGRAGKLFEKRETKKYYLALVRGHVQHELCDIEYDVGLDPLTAQTSHRMLVRKTPSCKSCVLPRVAHTRMFLLETGYYDKDPVSVVLLNPITGRRHQLRVHCAAIGHTILGDYTYSDAADNAPHRMFLHAMRLVLPVDGEHLDIQTTDPFFSDKKFTDRWKSCKKYHKFQSKEDFLLICDIVDKVYVLGVRYKRFVCKDK
ncbi:RNA pseudouridylate synthase domain-containing protein 1-like [Pectinophora gossypiella]|uniref:RNA pseudouridylate synthase domain-containing protein 1-like n=1 Tax=Pectinophora gossypiella TaxID=13191 RepID=UPI00214DF4DE|nr:RNA pseudouridylate synthase domain-containing protein 1-like [Pectinophora gossypiella]